MKKRFFIQCHYHGAGRLLPRRIEEVSMSKYNTISKYTNIQDYLKANDYTWNKDTSCYEKKSYMGYALDTIPWAETKGHTVDSFAAKARAKQWVPVDGTVVTQ